MSDPSSKRSPESVAFIALVLGAIAMGGSVVFVRLTDVGPLTSAFWRVALALPFLFAWRIYAQSRSRRETNDPSRTPGLTTPVLLSGFFFAGDLIFWHLALVNTSVANATFMATMAPVFVLLLSGIVLREQVSRYAVFGLLMCLAGGVALVGTTIRLAPSNLIGDLYGLITALFFAGYFLSMRWARRSVSTANAMFFGSIVTAVSLLAVALILEEQFFPATLYGVTSLLALAFCAQVLGQGLLAMALGFLPASFSSLVIFLEAVAAAVFGWLVLHEALTVGQLFGGLLILLGIFVARRTVKFT